MSESWHGTRGGYTNHGCRCEDCTRANTEGVRAYRAKPGKAALHAAISRACYMRTRQSARRV